MTTENNVGSTDDQGDDNQDKFLSFILADEEYGVEILRVREIIGVLDITPLPQTASYVKGVVNLRGKIIPVIELRNKFGMANADYTEETCIIVVEVNDSSSGDQFEMGVIVDSVHEVKNVGKSQIQPAPKFGNSLNTEYIQGMGKVSDGDQQTVLILLDIDKVLSISMSAELARVGSDEGKQVA